MDTENVVSKVLSGYTEVVDEYGNFKTTEVPDIYAKLIKFNLLNNEFIRNVENYALSVPAVMYKDSVSRAGNLYCFLCGYIPLDMEILEVNKSNSIITSDVIEKFSDDKDNNLWKFLTTENNTRLDTVWLSKENLAKLKDYSDECGVSLQDIINAILLSCACEYVE